MMPDIHDRTKRRDQKYTNLTVRNAYRPDPDMIPAWWDALAYVVAFCIATLLVIEFVVIPLARQHHVFGT